MVHLLAVILIVSLSLNKAEANSWEKIEVVDGTQESPYLDVKEASIQIKTQSKIGSGDEFVIEFYDDSDKNNNLWIEFTESSIQFWLHRCSEILTDFTNAVPSEEEKVWTITHIKEGPRMKVHCNEVEILDLLISDEMCTYADWSKYWTNFEVTRIGLTSKKSGSIDGYRMTPQEDEDTGNEEGGDTGNEEGGDIGHYSHAFNCKASGIVLASFLCVLNLII